MPEEIMNEVVPTVVEETVKNVIATPKKVGKGKVAIVVTLVTGAAALGYLVYKKATGKSNPKEKAKADDEVVDNVKVAERDFVDKNESKE